MCTHLKIFAYEAHQTEICIGNFPDVFVFSYSRCRMLPKLQNYVVRCCYKIRHSKGFYGLWFRFYYSCNKSGLPRLTNLAVGLLNRQLFALESSTYKKIISKLFLDSIMRIFLNWWPFLSLPLLSYFAIIFP